MNNNKFVRQIKQRDSKGLEYVVDNYSNLVFKIIYDVLNSRFHSQYEEENNKELFQAIDLLNVEDREIFIRRYFLHEGIENVAKDFGLERNLVDQRLSRGRKFLKEKLILLRGGNINNAEKTNHEEFK